MGFFSQTLVMPKDRVKILCRLPCRGAGTETGEVVDYGPWSPGHIPKATRVIE